MSAHESLRTARPRGRVWWFLRFVRVYRRHRVLRFNGGLRGAWRDAQFSRRAMNAAEQRALRPLRGKVAVGMRTPRRKGSLFAPVVDWRKWGFGASVEFGDPAFLRLWIGPVRIGWKWGHAAVVEYAEFPAGQKVVAVGKNGYLYTVTAAKL